MRITCPACAAEYDLPAALPPGKLVRCVRCREQWAPVALPPPTEWPDRITVPDRLLADRPPADPLPPAPSSRDTVPLMPLPFMTLPENGRAPHRTASGRAALALAWLSSALLLAALLTAGYVFRVPIMQGWPPSTRLFAALGLA